MCLLIELDVCVCADDVFGLRTLVHIYQTLQTTNKIERDHTRQNV